MTTHTAAPLASYELPLDQSPAADAANAALRAGFETAKEARASWDLVREAFPGQAPLADRGAAENAARRIAVRLEQSVRRTYGLVSNSAAGLFGVTLTGRVGVVEGTTSGSDYLDLVQWLDFDGKAWTPGLADEVPVSEFAAFFDTIEAVQEHLYPAPRRGLFAR